MNVIGLHEYGGLRHMYPLECLANEGHITFSHHVIRNPVLRLVSNVRHRRFHDLLPGLQDAAMMAKLMRLPPATLILGAAPYSPLIFYLERLRTRHRIIYHSSWPHWGPGGGVHHGDSVWLRQRWLTWLDGLDAVGVTCATRDALASHGAKASAIPHSVDMIDEVPERLSDDHVRVVFSGRMIHAKGIELLIQCIHNLKELPIVWQFAGEGPLLPKVRALKAQGYAVEAPGHLSQGALNALYKSADLFVLPSFRDDQWEELFGIVIIEAFAAGVPAVVTDCVGPQEIVTDGKDGVVIPQRDQPALEDAIRRLVKDRDLRLAMGKQARAKALAQYSTKVVTRQWLDVIKNA